LDFDWLGLLLETQPRQRRMNMTAAQLNQPRLAPGSIVITPEMSFSMAKAGFDVARFGAYHGSQDTRFRDFTTGGFASNSRPESDYFPRNDRARVIARLRVGIRNNPYLYAILRNYVLALGTPHLKSQTSDADYNDSKERLFARWAQDCEVEHDLSLDQVVEIYNYESCIAGELFVIKRREGWLQLIASELCGSAQIRGPLAIPAGTLFADGTPVPVGSTERDGVVRDVNKFIVGYRFGQRDELGLVWFSPERSTIVQKQYVFHLFDPDRVEQGRGVPLLAPVMNVGQDVFETAESRAQQVKNASMLSLWITKSIDPTGFANSQRGVLNMGAGVDPAVLKEIATTRSAHKEVRTGQVMYGALGETLDVVTPKLNAGDWHEHYIDLVQVICACLNGMPVEVGIEGFRDSSYSSARSTMNIWKNNVARIRRRLSQRFLEPLQLWQVNRARVFGDIGPAPKSQNPSATYNTDENVRFGWPGIPDIDGAKTSAQNALDLANGTTTRETIYADKGEDRDHQDKIFAGEKASLLTELIAAGMSSGLEEAAAKSWAISQMPAQDPRVLAALLTATGALGDVPPPAGRP
jgi:capsid protein